MKSLNQMRKDKRIEEILHEGPGEYFVNLAYGWIMEEQHSFGEDTVQGIYETLRRVTPCACAECFAHQEEQKRLAEIPDNRWDIYQIPLHDLHDEINRLGWDEAARQFLAVDAHLKCSTRGSHGWEELHRTAYRKVCEIDSETLDELFEIGNIGPADRIKMTPPNARMHSISVGDIMANPKNGDSWMVNPIGFGYLGRIETFKA